MRIGIFTDTYFPQISGVATSIRILKEELEQKGHTVIIFTTTDPNAPDYEENIVRFASVPFLSFKERRVAVAGLAKAYRIARKYKLDIIHTQTEFSLGIMGKMLGMMLEIPTVHTYHTMYENYIHYIADGKLVKPSHVAYVSKAFCNQTLGVIAPSQLTKDTLVNYGVNQPVYVVPTGVKIPPQQKEVAQALRKQLGYTEEDIVLLSLSRLSKEKNIDELITAMPDILSKEPKAKLCIVGGGPAKEDLEKQVAELQLETVIQFAGEVDNTNVSNYYQMADLYINASHSESQGLTYLEALVNHIPLIVKRNDYLASLLTYPSLGMMFDDKHSLTDRIQTYLTSQFDEQKTQQAREELLARISSETFVEGALQVYEDAIKAYHWKVENDGNLMRKVNILKLHKDEEE